MKIKSHYLLLLIFLIQNPLFGQKRNTSIPQNWFLLDPQQDSVQGMSVEKAYNTLLKDKPSREIIVAVIDCGIDVNHEDLKDVIWTNKNEIPANGIDDDKNGHIDDYYGWNFIGGKNGNVGDDTDDLTREYIRLNEKFEDVKDGKVSKKHKAEYQQYLQIKDKFTKLKERNEQQYKLYAGIYNNMKQSIDTLKSLLKTDSLTSERVKNFQTEDPNLLFAKGFLLQIYRNAGEEANLDEYLSEVKAGADYFGAIVNYGYNVEFDSRKIIGDNYSDPFEKNYGNNDVAGPDAGHGTHVAGIIAANRNNDLGIKGVANHVKIMAVRAIPKSGDERDKDVANAIIYAVDNGAKIINMSFGKKFSPEKEAVDRAVKYAEQKGVLLIHAAGNDGDDIDVVKNFPTQIYHNGKAAKNWIEVGASSWGAGSDFVADFSNYGKKSVSLFAPGVQIYSTYPGNKYKNESGTSMACPATTGVAALLMSYFPDLSVAEVRDILLRSSRKFDGLKVQQPGDKKDVEFSSLSVSGGLINAYEAVKTAQETAKQKTVR
ncbi:MAG: S8 family peptidase [Bacteroidetes bacterium]|nr:S8 family peptidase [Bacteroidota bacterium]